MAHCYLCDAQIPRGGGNRRWVPVSRHEFISEGRSGLRIGFGASQGVRTICNACVLDQGEQAVRCGKLLQVLGVAVVIAVVALFVLGSMHR